jgi:GrpB-like predicted nucleotidyltransferase (UPF0157 family)
MKNKYIFKPYSERFPHLFVEEKKRLLDVLKEECLDIQHVGSTAVPHLGGKGIIDIAIAVDEKAIEKAISELESLGYIFRESGSTPERWFFRIDLPDAEEGSRRYHLHLTFLESSEWKRLLAFRDYLRCHPEAVQEYALLKKKSAEEVKENGALYRSQKLPFFKKVLSKGLTESS